MTTIPKDNNFQHFDYKSARALNDLSVKCEGRRAPTGLESCFLSRAPTHPHAARLSIQLSTICCEVVCIKTEAHAPHQYKCM